MKKQLFENKVVVVTGAASGIGAAVAKQFAEQGASVALLDQDGERLSEYEKELSASGLNVLGVTCDVSQEEACVSAIKKTMDRFGGVDILVNNAGITQRGPFEKTKTSVFKRTMDINFFGSLYCTKASLDSIIERKGMIIIIESIAGMTPLLGRTGYCASKHALHGLFTTLRCEIQDRGAHVMIVCPGFTKTNLQTRALGCDGDVTTHPQSTIGGQTTPENVARIILKGAEKRKNMLVMTLAGRLGYYINRLSPSLYEWIMEKKFRKELEL